MAWTPDRIVALAALCAAILAAEVVIGYRSGRAPFSVFDQLSALLASAGSMYVVASSRGALPWVTFAICLVSGLTTYAVADHVLRRFRGVDGSVRTGAIFLAWPVIGFASLFPAYMLQSSH
jgi:hypothetical protein